MKRVHENEHEEIAEEQSNENVVVAGPSNTAPKKKKRHSLIWNHYTVKLGSDGITEFGHCNYCAK